jgi:hypothetical protein
MRERKGSGETKRDLKVQCSAAKDHYNGSKDPEGMDYASPYSSNTKVTVTGQVSEICKTDSE